MDLVKPIYLFSDSRGIIKTIFHDGQWKEANYIETREGIVRGGHYHRLTREMVYIIEGEVKVDIKDINVGLCKYYNLCSGDMIVIEPYELHTFRTLKDSKWLNFLTIPFNHEQPDTYREPTDST